MAGLFNRRCEFKEWEICAEGSDASETTSVRFGGRLISGDRLFESGGRKIGQHLHEGVDHSLKVFVSKTHWVGRS